MMTAQPHIRCVDYWPDGIPPRKLAAYKIMIRAGQIRKRTAIVSAMGAVVVDYESTVPQDWIRKEMAEISAGLHGGENQ